MPSPFSTRPVAPASAASRPAAAPRARRGLPFLLALPVLALACLPARASSPEAWAAYDRQVRGACQRASGLRAVRIRGKRVDLPSLGLSTLLLEGVHPQPHMQGMRGQELCVYEQRSGRAAVAEADSWSAPASP